MLVKDHQKPDVLDTAGCEEHSMLATLHCRRFSRKLDSGATSDASSDPFKKIRFHMIASSGWRTNKER